MIPILIQLRESCNGILPDYEIHRVTPGRHHQTHGLGRRRVCRIENGRQGCLRADGVGIPRQRTRSEISFRHQRVDTICRKDKRTGQRGIGIGVGIEMYYSSAWSIMAGGLEQGISRVYCLHRVFHVISAYANIYSARAAGHYGSGDCRGAGPPVKVTWIVPRPLNNDTGPTRILAA